MVIMVMWSISCNWDMGSYDIGFSTTKGIIPPPQINETETLTENSFLLSWKTSINQNASFLSYSKQNHQVDIMFPIRCK